MPEHSQIAEVLRHYPAVNPQCIESLGGAGGFSGARFWRVGTGASLLCLRRWPKEHPSRNRLRWIHDVLEHVACRGFAKLPVPLRTRDGETFVTVADHLWELSSWLPGAADFHKCPISERLESALASLALFHRGSESFESQTQTAPGLSSRKEQLDQLRRRGTRSILGSVAAVDWPEFRRRATSILHCFAEQSPRVQPLVDSAARVSVTLQPCIRDLWHDHVLFESDEVCGFVDFGAMQTDHVASDISRLLGSLVGSDSVRWKQGLAAYQSLRPLSTDELMLIDAYDKSLVLLSGMNWIQWIAVEGRVFDDRQRVLRRMDQIIERLHQMCGTSY
jgi:Ser/Thr protein kinase RdoA (MazF antagonist)